MSPKKKDRGVGNKVPLLPPPKTEVSLPKPLTSAAPAGQGMRGDWGTAGGGSPPGLAAPQRAGSAPGALVHLWGGPKGSDTRSPQKHAGACPKQSIPDGDGELGVPPSVSPSVPLITTFTADLGAVLGVLHLHQLPVLFPGEKGTGETEPLWGRGHTGGCPPCCPHHEGLT